MGFDPKFGSQLSRGIFVEVEKGLKLWGVDKPKHFLSQHIGRNIFGSDLLQIDYKKISKKFHTFAPNVSQLLKQDLEKLPLKQW